MYLIKKHFCFLFFVIGKQKGSFKKKIQLIFGLAALAAVAFLMLQLIFPRVLDLFLYRFTHYDLTTGRDGLFIQYSKFILSDFKNLFYGIGLNDLGNKSIIYYDIADVVSHNGIQEIVLAWGIPGLILYGIFTFDLIASSRKVNPCQKLINYIPAILIFTKIQAGQIITSGYTLLTFALCYLSLCHNFYPDEAEQKGFKKLN